MQSSPHTDPASGFLKKTLLPRLAVLTAVTIGLEILFLNHIASHNSLLHATLLIIAVVVISGGAWLLIRRQIFKTHHAIKLQTEADRVRSEEKFAKAFHAGAAMMAISTLDEGRYLDVNNTFVELLGFSREEVIGHTSIELGLIEPETRNNLVQRFKAREVIHNVEIEFHTRSGVKRHGLFSIEGLDLGKTPCVLTAMTDITDIRRSEQELQQHHLLLEQQIEERTAALRESENLYRTLFEHMEQGVVYRMADGRITNANPAAERILGLSLADMQHCDSASHQWTACREDGSPFPPDECPDVRCMASGQPVHGVVMGVRHAKTDELRWILMDSVPEYLPGAPRPFRAFTSIVDITDGKNMQNQLFQAQKMESIGRLAGGIAHDFNNSLYCISGFSELMLDSMPDDSPHRHYISQIQRATQQAADMTRQLLAFSRQQIIQPRLEDINKLISDQQRILRRLIGEDIAINTQLQPGTACAVVDPAQFLQVLMNLCVNARDAMPQGGTLTVETLTKDDVSPPPGGRNRAGRYVCLRVTDTGTGMSEETRSHIFEPFFTTKEMGKGTGLGLAVVLGIVQQHGGWIDVESQSDRGSRFSVYFPCAETGTETPITQPARTEKGSGQCVLLVEDAPAVRELVAIRLRKLGYRVIEAPDTERGLQAFLNATEPIHILLSDVVLPDGNGITLAEKITAVNPSVRVILCSGYADDRSRINEIQQRQWTFLAKPFSKQAIASVLQGVASSAPECPFN
jgi:two-component system cell cycle sensor histidine kinase/response regulator CckA